MAGEDIITMSQRELKRLHVIHKVLDRAVTQAEAAGIIALSTRQIRRVIKRIRQEGDTAIAHRLRGKPSNRALPKKIKDKALKLFREKYSDFGPTLASEKLFEIDKIKINDETLRLWLIKENIPYRSRRKRPHREWRERKHCLGEMIQIDGSHHDWFEGRGPECVLMGYIDDATGNVFARFYPYEGIIPAMDSFKRYIRQYGIPLSVYLDRHSTYKSTAKPSIEDELEGINKPLTHFGRALKELAVELVYANSPQAKGRIERLFKTFQDRLVKEMRLRGIKTVDEANEFLKYYLPIHNKRFAVKPREKADLHRPIPKGINLDNVLSVKTERTLRKDFTVAHDKKLYQIKDNVSAKKVTVEERINGSMIITHNGISLGYKEITQRPEPKDKPKPYIFTVRKIHKPSVTHPWKRCRTIPHINSYQQREKGSQKEKELLLTVN